MSGLHSKIGFILLVLVLFIAPGCSSGTTTAPTQPPLTNTPTLQPTEIAKPTALPTQPAYPAYTPFQPYPGGVTLEPTQLPYSQPQVTQPVEPTATTSDAYLPPPTLAPSPSVYPGPAEVTPFNPYTNPTPPVQVPASPYPGNTPTFPSAPTGIPTPTRPRQTQPAGTVSPTSSASATERPISTAMPPPRDNLKTVSIWHAWEPGARQTLDDILKLFQEVNPDVQFNVMYVPLDQLRDKYIEATYRGDGPSLVLGPADWGPDFYDQGLIADISGIAEPNFLATINPAALQEAQYRSVLIGLPYSIRNGVVLYRNKKIISTPPASLDELISLSKAVTRGGIVGAYLERSFFFSGANLYGIGGKLMDQNGNPTFNAEKGIEWLNLLASFKQAGATEFNGNRDIEWFKAGEIGFVIDGTWNRTQLAQAIGAENLSIDPWPVAGSGHLSGFLQTDNIYLNANITGGERYAALQVMGFLLARQIQPILSRAGQIPAVMDLTVNDALMQQAMEVLKGATAYPILPEIQAFWAPLELAMTSVFAGTTPPAEALKQAETDVRMHLPEYRP